MVLFLGSCAFDDWFAVGLVCFVWVLCLGGCFALFCLFVVLVVS